MAQKTVVFPLNLNEQQEGILVHTIKLFSQAYNACLDCAWSMDHPVKKELHKKTYYLLKELLGLKSQYLCVARDTACETVLSVRARLRKGKKASKPRSGLVPIRLDKNTLSFDKTRETASITTQGKRIKVPLLWHKHAKRFEKWPCQSGRIGFDGRGRLVLWLIFEKEVEKPKRTGKVIGIDRGIKNAFVTSENKFYEEGKSKDKERLYYLLISRLQSAGTKSAKQHLKLLSGRLRRFKVNCDHRLAKMLFATLNPGDTLVLEKLTGIRDNCGAKGKARKKHRKHLNRWSFKRLADIITSFAEFLGVYVEYVDPRYTSQQCSKCGIVKKSNRKNQSTYRCSCGLELNADLNAARNISRKWCMANGYTSGHQSTGLL